MIHYNSNPIIDGDDLRHFHFPRTTKLPVGTFPRCWRVRRSRSGKPGRSGRPGRPGGFNKTDGFNKPDAFVFVACIVLVVWLYFFTGIV